MAISTLGGRSKSPQGSMRKKMQTRMGVATTRSKAPVKRAMAKRPASARKMG